MSIALSCGSEAPVAATPARRRRRMWRTVGLVAATAVVLGLVLPAIQASLQSARRARCVEQLKRLGVAFHEYHAAQEHFPAAAITGKDGRPLLSWRVALLPQLGYQSLYDQFHRDEPWDSPRNRALLAQMPPVFACPGLFDRRPGFTAFQVVVGPKAGFGAVGTLFETARGVDMREIIDGTSNTLMVVETDRAVPWTKPEDIPYDPAGPLPHFGGLHPGGFNVLFGDGSTRFLKHTIAPVTLKAILTRDGGEVLGGG